MQHCPQLISHDDFKNDDVWGDLREEIGQTVCLLTFCLARDNVNICMHMSMYQMHNCILSQGYAFMCLVPIVSLKNDSLIHFPSVLGPSLTDTLTILHQGQPVGIHNGPTFY